MRDADLVVVREAQQPQCTRLSRRNDDAAMEAFVPKAVEDYKAWS
jgi:hypothetical protein